jgi:hypothetical protein
MRDLRYFYPFSPQIRVRHSNKIYRKVYILTSYAFSWQKWSKMDSAANVLDPSKLKVIECVSTFSIVETPVRQRSISSSHSSGSNCSAINCVNQRAKGISLHHFPKDQKLRSRWISACRRESFEPGIHSLLCSQHFLESDYTTTSAGKRPKLKHGAVPSLFDFSPNVASITTTPWITGKFHLIRTLPFSGIINLFRILD